MSIDAQLALHKVDDTAGRHEMIPLTDRLAILAFDDDGLWCFRLLLDGEIVWGLDPWTWGSCETN